MRRVGMTFIEILVACAILVVVIVPLGSLLYRSQFETRASVDEFLASLYLSEVVDQVASIPFQRLPIIGPVDLSGSEVVQLESGDETTEVHVCSMRANFTARKVSVSEVSLPPGCLKAIHAVVEYTRHRGKHRSLEMVTYVGRGSVPLDGEGE